MKSRVPNGGGGRGDKAESGNAVSGPVPGKRTLTESLTAQPGLDPVGPRRAGPAVASESAAESPDATVRARTEQVTGANLGDVRVHTDAGSNAAAQALSARAFTVGQDIHFAQGTYRPGSIEGDHLLAHELAHTVQQGASAGEPQPQLEVGQPGDAAEREADAVAGAVIGNGGTIPVTQHTGAMLQRDESVGEKFKEGMAKVTSFFAGGIGQVVHWAGVGPKPDWAGKAILERYLAGTGDWHIRGDRDWKDYMMNCEHLREKVLQELVREILPQLRNGVGTHLFTRRFQADTGVSSATPSGYGYLHGTDANAGGFEMSGVYSVFRPAEGGWVVSARLEFDWGDNIDPNGWQDAAGDVVAWLLSFGQREPYKIVITWDSFLKLRFDPKEQLIETDGYPGEWKPSFRDSAKYPYPSDNQR